MSQCSRCLLPGAVPGADLDAAGVCGPCRLHAIADPRPAEEQRRRFAADLEQALRDCRGQGVYDCLVNLSGGKDSCYLLYKLKVEYGLNVLAFTTDMFLPPIAWDNINRTVEKLGVDLLVYRPPKEFYRKLFRWLLQNQEARGAVRTVCYVCAPLYEGYSLAFALEKKIPLILAGYSPGQPDPARMQYEYARELIEQRDWTPPELRAAGVLSAEDEPRFWNPRRYPPGTQFPRYLAPFHAWDYSQAKVMEKVVKLGLISNKRRASPVHSNCPVNWLLMYSDLKHLGYNPYTPEFSRLIREGKASRFYWRLMGPIVNAMLRTRTFLGREVTRSLAWLGLGPADLRITRAAADEDRAPGSANPFPGKTAKTLAPDASPASTFTGNPDQFKTMLHDRITLP